MITSLIIPFRNEKEYAEFTLVNTHSFLTKSEVSFEIIAVDDSSDGTWEILKSFASNYDNVIVIKGGSPPGYGKALLTGFKIASGDIIIPFNGDNSDSLEDVLRYTKLINNGYDMVFGSRYMKQSSISGSSPLKGGISRLGNLFLQFVFRANCTDLTNSFKAYKKEVITSVQPSSAGYELGMELAIKAICTGYKYTTIPISWTEREMGRSKMAVFRTALVFTITAIKMRYSQMKLM